MNTYTGDTPLTRFLASQTLAQLREMKSAVRSEIEAARARVAELESDQSRIEAAIQEKGGGRRGNGRPSAPAPRVERTEISLRQAILSLMRDRPGYVWSTQEMLDELHLRSHAPGGAKPLNTVGSRMIEMSKKGLIVRNGRGTYSLAPSRDEEFTSPGEAGDSN